MGTSDSSTVAAATFAASWPQAEVKVGEVFSFFFFS